MPGDLIPQDGKIKVTGAAVRSARRSSGVGIRVGGDPGRAPQSHAIPRSGTTAPTAGFPVQVLARHRPHAPDAAAVIRRPGEPTSMKTLSCGEAPQGSGAFKT
ncbi:hypothetical protein [Methylobacterium sp. ap11]|uniref:hypothetical protein n=1 Tax=Methylobacterium sp. ap11 TaxID=1761799 RepID=UPI001160C7F7|nr:hypothetical protein [Methylobacterium sp. ap11]